MLDILAMLALISVGMVMGLEVSHKIPDYQDGSYDEIVACEKSLTRDQHCMLVAVPEKEVKNENIK